MIRWWNGKKKNLRYFIKFSFQHPEQKKMPTFFWKSIQITYNYFFWKGVWVLFFSPSLGTKRKNKGNGGKKSMNVI